MEVVKIIVLSIIGVIVVGFIAYLIYTTNKERKEAIERQANAKIEQMRKEKRKGLN